MLLGFTVVVDYDVHIMALAWDEMMPRGRVSSELLFLQFLMLVTVPQKLQHVRNFYMFADTCLYPRQCKPFQKIHVHALKKFL